MALDSTFTISGGFLSNGIYERGEDVEHKDALGTAAGYTSSSDAYLLNQKNTVNLNMTEEKNIGIGYEYYLKGFPSDGSYDVQFIVYHPEIFNNGKSYTKSEGSLSIYVQNGYAIDHAVYWFSKEYEKVKGTWKIDIYYKNRLLLTKSFITN